MAVQQKDNLCGPFHAARVLVEYGVEQWDGEPLDQDLVALRAGTLLPDLPPERCVPRGADSQADYRHRLPVVPAERAGTSPAALGAAIESASNGALRAIPLKAVWNAARVVRLVSFAPELGARLIANLRTGMLWGTRPPEELVMGELAGRQMDGPDPEWDVGHFCELSSIVRGVGGALVVVHDSYPELGWHGVHLQPPRVVATALSRDDGREGGVLCVVPAAAAGRLEGLGFEIDFWDNGTRR